jgi:hypothetical protein
VAQSSGAAKSRAASLAGVSRGSRASTSRTAGAGDESGDSSDGSFATASPRGTSRGSRASDHSAASSERKKRGSRASSILCSSFAMFGIICFLGGFFRLAGQRGEGGGNIRTVNFGSIFLV